MTNTLRTATALAALLLAGCGDGASVGGESGAVHGTVDPDAGPGSVVEATPVGASAGAPVATPVETTIGPAPSRDVEIERGPAAVPGALPAIGAASPPAGSFEVGLLDVDVRRRSTGERLALDVENVFGAPLEVVLE